LKITDITPAMFDRAKRVEAGLLGRFAEIDAVAQENTLRVMAAFQDQKVTEGCFAGTTGYGYDDMGREVLDKVYAQVFGAEAALVRIGFVNGTHAISAALFAALRPGDTLLSVTGAPYDTMRTVIGIAGDEYGSLRFYGGHYDQVDLKDGAPDYDIITARTAGIKPAAVLIQRSRGYEERKALSIAEIGQIVTAVKTASPETIVVVDNCYGEFTETQEPTYVGADIIAGSLIKNPGGGIAPMGGYLAGRRDLIDRAANRLTTPGIGAECGASLGNNRLLFQGLFLAPHTVAQALKTAVFCSALFTDLGFETYPGPLEPRDDIVQMVKLKTPENLCKFCRGIQSGSPVDSFVAPEPWQMPGYDCEVIMAAGAFIQGSSIELSADGPMREPYIAYVQGGLTYESGKLGILLAASEMMDK
jgi:cystathionine beta-lyase family protein involved in aluminum resistance